MGFVGRERTDLKSFGAGRGLPEGMEGGKVLRSGMGSVVSRERDSVKGGERALTQERQPIDLEIFADEDEMAPSRMGDALLRAIEFRRSVQGELDPAEVLRPLRL